MSAAARDAVIQQHLQTLKLPAFRRSYEALARQAGAEGWPYEDYLRELLEAEVRSRQERAAACRLREAHSPISRRSIRSTGRRCPASRGRRSSSWQAATTSSTRRPWSSPVRSAPARPISPSPSGWKRRRGQEK
jgi:hypothetical protein